jgi:hypothetical protein
MVCSFLLGVEMQAQHADAKNPARLSRPGGCLERYWCQRSGIPWLGRADIGHDADNKIVTFGGC